MKAFILVFAMAFLVFGQQINYTYGVKKTSGDAWDGNGLLYIDTTRTTTNDIIIDLNDYFFVDANPVALGDSSDDIIGNSDNALIGTFYCYFDNEGTASPTTDSLKYTIKAYAGIYTDDSRSVANIKYHATAVTLETLAAVGDQYTINNVYVEASLGKTIPPEVIKIEIAPVASSNGDDSTHVSWRFAYPAIYKVHQERK